MSNLPFTLPGCDRPATVRIEVYGPDPAGDPFGSLDASVYACDPHDTDVVAAVWAANLNTYRVILAPDVQRTCGEAHIYPTGNLGGAR